MNNILLAAVLSLVAASVSAQTICAANSDNNVTCTPGTQAPGTAALWEWKNVSDNGIARLTINSEGLTSGAAPNGFAELRLRSQDEMRDPFGRVTSSSDFVGVVRAMSHSYGYTTDQTVGHCRGTQCPDMLEVYSSKNLRLTTANNGTFDVVAGTREGTQGAEPAPRVSVSKDGVKIPDLAAPAHRRYFVCVDDTGTLTSQPTPCNQ